MTSSVSACFTVSLPLLFWLLLSNFHLLSKCKAQRLLLGGVWLWTWTFFHEVLSFAARRFICKQALFDKCSSQHACFAHCHGAAPSCLAACECHLSPVWVWTWLLLGSDERASPLGLILWLLGIYFCWDGGSYLRPVNNVFKSWWYWAFWVYFWFIITHPTQRG